MALRVYKYPTGGEIPIGAIFMSTQTETRTTIRKDPLTDGGVRHEVVITENILVWHYFLVETDA